MLPKAHRSPLSAVDDSIHVYPLFGRDHDTDNGLDCWCCPERDASFHTARTYTLVATKSPIRIMYFMETRILTH